MMSDSAAVTDWLNVGSREACGRLPVEAIVHIFRSDAPDLCCQFATRTRDLRMDFREGEELSASNLRNLSVFAKSLSQSRCSTLVHCHAGAYRSPLIAAYLLATVEGGHALDAFASVQRAIFDQRGVLAFYHERPFRQLMGLLHA